MEITRRTRRIARAALVLTLGLGVLAPSAALADSRDDLVRKQQENAAEREEVESSLEGVDTDLAETYLKLEDARAKLPVAQQKLAEAEEVLAAEQRTHDQIAARLAIAEDEAVSLENAIAEGATKIDNTRAAMGELARSTYRGDNAASTISMVLDASSSEEFLRGYAVVETAARAQTQVLDDLEVAAAVGRNQRERQEAVTVRIGELKVDAAEAVEAADAARGAAEQHAAEIAELEAQMETLAATLEEQKIAYSDQLAELEADNADLAREIAAIDEENRRKEEERLARERAAGAAAAPPASSSGSLTPPVPNPMYVTSGYGYRIYPITGGWWMHNGTDIRSACGNPQFSAADGQVTAVRPARGNGTHGNQVIINHGYIGGSSYVTVYNHLSGFAVSQGQWVSQGQTIGSTGATGNVTGCHVHFEVWRNGSTIDPMGLPGFIKSN